MVGQVIDVRLAFPSLGVVREGNHGTDDFLVPESWGNDEYATSRAYRRCPEYLVIHVETSSSPEVWRGFYILELHEFSTCKQDQERHIPAGQISNPNPSMRRQLAFAKVQLPSLSMPYMPSAAESRISSRCSCQWPAPGLRSPSSAVLFHDVLQGGQQPAAFGHAVERRHRSISSLLCTSASVKVPR